MKTFTVWSVAVLWLSAIGTSRPVTNDAGLLPALSVDDDLADVRERSMVAAIKKWHDSTNTSALLSTRQAGPSLWASGETGPAVTDVEQGSQSNTCSLMSVLAAYAHHQPAFIESLFVELRGRVWIRLKPDIRAHKAICGVVRWDQVDGSVQDPTMPRISVSNALWPRLIVQAYKDLADFDCTSAEWFMEGALTMFSGEYQTAITELNDVASMYRVFRAASTKPGIVSTRGDIEPSEGGFLQPRHTYAIITVQSADAVSKSVMLYNPAGTMKIIPLENLVGKLDRAAVVGYPGGNQARAWETVRQRRQEGGQCTWQATPPEAADAVSWTIEEALRKKLPADEIIGTAERVLSFIGGAAAIAAARAVLDAAKDAKDHGKNPQEYASSAAAVATAISTGSSVNTADRPSTATSTSNVVSTGTTPKQETTSTTPKQETTSTTPKQETTSTTPKQETTSTTPKQETTSTTPKQETTSTTPKEETTSTSSNSNPNAETSTGVQTSTSIGDVKTRTAPQTVVWGPVPSTSKAPLPGDGGSIVHSPEGTPTPAPDGQGGKL